MRKKSSTQRNLRQTTLFEQFSSSPPRAPPPKSTPKKQAMTIVEESDSKSDSDESHVADIAFESDEVDDDDDIQILQSSPRRKRKIRISSGRSDTEKPVIPEASGSKQKPGQHVKRRRLEDSDDEDRPIKGRDYNQTSNPELSGEDEAVSAKVPARRRLIHKPDNPLEKNESEEEDLKGEIDEDYIISARFRQRDKKSTFQKNLERLKRRKLKQPEKLSSSSESQAGDSDVEVISQKPFRGAKPTIELADSDEANNDEDEEEEFIVEDDGTAEQVELPIEFSMGTHQDFGHHFKTIFQFFVHVAVQPPERRGDFMQDAIKNTQYFSVPLQIARRKLLGLRDSLVTSSVWRPEFKNPLMKYPELEVAMLDFALPGCSACRLGGRLSSRIGYLKGKPYNLAGFEPVRDSDQDEDDDVNGDEGGDEGTPRTKMEFPLGRFCARRCRVFHAMCHWEYALYKTIRQEIDSLRAQRAGRGFVKVSHAQGKRPPRDLTNADKLMEWLDDRQIVEREWSNIRKLMQDAHDLEFASKRGETD